MSLADNVTSLAQRIATEIKSLRGQAALKASANVFAQAASFGEDALTDAATIAWDVQASPAARVTLGGNRTLGAPANMAAGATYVLRVVQDATGGRTLAFNVAYKFPGGAAPTLSTDANAIDLLSFYSDGTSLYGTALVGMD